MILLSKFSFIFVLLQLSFGQLRLASSQTSTTKAMEAHWVVPDVIDVAPAASIKVNAFISIP